MILRKNDLRGSKMVIEHLQRNETFSILESNRYSSECKKEWFDHDYASPNKGPKDKKGRVKNSGGANQRRGGGRRNVDGEEDEDDDEENENENNDDGAVAEASDCSLDESDMSSAESTTDVSMDHSDWGSDDSQVWMDEYS